MNKIWDNNDDWYYNKIIEWDDGYKKRKAQKAQIKKLIKREKKLKELMRVAWHPLRWWNWCVPKDEKEETEKFF